MANEIAVIKAARSATEALRAEAARLVTKYGELVEKRDRAKRQLAPITEIVQNISRLVDAERAEFVKRRGRAIAQDLGGHFDTLPRSSREQFIKPVLPHSLGAIGEGLSFRDLCGLVPSLIKQELERIVKEGNGEHLAKAGDRERILAELDQAITAVEVEHSELVSQAAGVGVELALLPHVAVEREREAEGSWSPVGVKGEAGAFRN